MATLLFCEDDPTIRKLIRAALRSTTHTLLEAGDGTEGLALAERERPAVIVTDLAMPAMDGYQLLAALLNVPALAGIPVVLLTASTQRAELEEARRRGFAAVLVKPFSPADLRATIERLVAGPLPERG